MWTNFLDITEMVLRAFGGRRCGESHFLLVRCRIGHLPFSHFRCSNIFQSFVQVRCRIGHYHFPTPSRSEEISWQTWKRWALNLVDHWNPMTATMAKQHFGSELQSSGCHEMLRLRGQGYRMYRVSEWVPLVSWVLACSMPIWRNTLEKRGPLQRNSSLWYKLDIVLAKIVRSKRFGFFY